MFFVFEILNFENRFYFLPHITTHFQPNTSLLNSSLGGFTPVIDSTGKITGYTTTIGGADTVFPFSNINTIKISITTWTSFSGNINDSPKSNSGAKYNYNIVFTKQADGTFKCTSGGSGSHTTITWNGLKVAGNFGAHYQINSITIS